MRTLQGTTSISKDLSHPKVHRHCRRSCPDYKSIAAVAGAGTTWHMYSEALPL